jgi:hypothetical protein
VASRFTCRDLRCAAKVCDKDEAASSKVALQMMDMFTNAAMPAEFWCFPSKLRGT